MAWSRTYLQVHWLTDVIAGALLGIGVSLLVLAIAQRHESWVVDRVLGRRGFQPPRCNPRASLRRRDASATLPGWRRPTG
jgi:membrane-associated phospholipid phosphatase